MEFMKKFLIQTDYKISISVHHCCGHIIPWMDPARKFRGRAISVVFGSQVS